MKSTVWLLAFLCLLGWSGPLTEARADEAVSVGVDELAAVPAAADPNAYAAVNEAAAGEGGPDVGKETDRPPAKLLQVGVETVSGQPLVRLKTTRAVRAQLTYLTRPERVLVKLPASLHWQPAKLEAGIPPLLRVRAAQHGAEAWVVLDLAAPSRWKIETDAQGLRLTPETLAAGTVAPEAYEAPEAPAGEAPVPARLTAGATYQVADLAVEDEGEKTRLVITTDGPVRYQVKREKDDLLSVTVLGASLGWSGALPAPVGAIRRVQVQPLLLAGEPVVRVAISLLRSTPYILLKDQNQVIVELDNPGRSGEAAPGRGSLRSRLSVDFQNADLAAALRALTQDAGFDLVLTPGTQPPEGPADLVSVSIKDQPLSSVLDVILRPRRMAYEVEGNTLRVGRVSEFPAQTRVFTLKSIDAQQTNLKDSIQSVLTEGAPGKVIVDERNNRVVVTAIPSDLRRVESVLGQMDVLPRTVTRRFHLNHAQADKLAGIVDTMLSSQGTVNVNAAANELVVTDLSGNLGRLAGLIRSMDSRSKQVMIEARIVEIDLAARVDLGIHWNPANASTGPLTIGQMPDGTNVKALLAALEPKGLVNIISNPRIATLDNQPARLTASQNIPYHTSVVNNGVVQSSVAYLELPISLEVTPHIAQNNQVLLDPITLSVTTAANQSEPPETSTRSAATQMRVTDGETVAIGGILRDRQVTKENKVPVLGDIPLLGYFFKGMHSTKEKVELVVFLTTHVLE